MIKLSKGDIGWTEMEELRAENDALKKEIAGMMSVVKEAKKLVDAIAVEAYRRGFELYAIGGLAEALSRIGGSHRIETTG